MVLEDVVPVVLVWGETFYPGVNCDHVAGHSLAGGIGVKAAVDLETLMDEPREPARIRSGAGRGYTQAMGMKFKAADCIDSGFAQNDGFCVGSGKREVAEVFLGTRRHATPAGSCYAAKFGAHGFIFFSKQKENGIASVVGIKPVGFDQALDTG